tara:strand:- start:944 stop:1435 length:492 start_codon:yes stop_codon:yes gene_type:complete
MDLSRNIQMDLLYLTNDRARRRVACLENGVNKEDLKFYRKRILQQTKEYLREGRLENMIDRAFDNYADKLIEYYKFIDKKEIIQKEYEFMKDGKKEHNVKDINLMEENKKMMKEVEPPVKTIKDFVNVVAEKPKKKRVIPQLKKFNLKKEELRIKGLKKEKSK